MPRRTNVLTTHVLWRSVPFSGTGPDGLGVDASGVWSLRISLSAVEQSSTHLSKLLVAR